jgi:hypothetical protein
MHASYNAAHIRHTTGWLQVLDSRLRITLQTPLHLTLLYVFGLALSFYMQHLTLQLGQVEHQQSLAASEAALAPLNAFQRNQVSL